MTSVNYWHLFFLLTDLMDEEVEHDPVLPLDDNDKAGTKELFGRHLLPIHRERPAHIEKKVKDSLRYFLTTRKAPLENLLDNLQDRPIGVPDDPYALLEWLWEVLYPGEDFRIADLSGFVERNDESTANEVCRPAGGWKP